MEMVHQRIDSSLRGRKSSQESLSHIVINSPNRAQLSPVDFRLDTVHNIPCDGKTSRGPVETLPVPCAPRTEKQPYPFVPLHASR